MYNKSRIIIGVVIVILFLIGIVALGQTQTDVTNTNSTNITNQNDKQIQNNSIDTVVKCSLDNDKSSKVNIKSKSVNVNKYSKVNTKYLSNLIIPHNLLPKDLGAINDPLSIANKSREEYLNDTLDRK